MNDFNYSDERFADLQLLRYRLNGFESLSRKQKILVFCLAKASLFGRDITFDQQGKFNLRIRKVLEVVYQNYSGSRNQSDFKCLETYLKRVWFSSGIYHHYGCEKFKPLFSESFLRDEINKLTDSLLPLRNGETKDMLIDDIFPVIFNPELLNKRVNQKDGDDLVATSACNFYHNVSQKEVEDFYNGKKQSFSLMNPEKGNCQPSWGLNSTIVKDKDGIHEVTWKENSMYGNAIKMIITWLTKALNYTENDKQYRVIEKLIKYYQTGDLSDFDDYSIEWVKQNEGRIDFINGFIEVYGDPLGLKGTWEGIVEYTDLEATKRTQTISNNAQWFEDHSPVASQFKKEKVKGVNANVINAAMLGGDEYPASAIGINLPNANWIRSSFGSKSVTIGNLTESYNKAAIGNGLREEFVIDKSTCEMMNKYSDMTDDLHTDLHECLGHGSGKLLPDTDPDALKAYGNTIEEARADLFGLYYMADDKMVELGLLPDMEAFKVQYYSYLMNGLLTQTMRIKLGDVIEEAHMRNRALISWWAMDLGQKEYAKPVVEIFEKNSKHYLKINDYTLLRNIFAKQLAEIQRIRSEGDYSSARFLVEKYAVNIDNDLHKEIIDRYAALNLAPYKGFINPRMSLVYDDNGKIGDVVVDYKESFTEQNLRYSKEYATLI
nr:dihydrofolate reductase [Prevotella sp.]